MKKYIGLIRIETMTMSGCDVRIKSRFYDSEQEVEDWITIMKAKYLAVPERNSIDSMIMENTESLNRFFEIFEDFTPVSDSEKQMSLLVAKELREMMERD